MILLQAVVLLVALLMVPARDTLAQATVELCRNVPEDFSCRGPTSEFTTTDRTAWILISIPQPGLYEIRVEWVAPDGSIYATHSDRLDRTGTFSWRFPLVIQAEQPETLPDEWAVRVLVGGQPVGAARFRIRLVGELKVFIPAFGPASVVRAVTASRVESSRPVEERREFKLGEPLFVFAQIRVPAVQSHQVGRRVPFRWRWIAPSAEALEQQGQFLLQRTGTTLFNSWQQLPSLEGTVQQSLGTWQIEYEVDGAVMVPRGKLTFSMTP